MARRYESKSFRRTRGSSAGGTAGKCECALGGACFLRGLFRTVDIAISSMMSILGRFEMVTLETYHGIHV